MLLNFTDGFLLRLIGAVEVDLVHEESLQLFQIGQVDTTVVLEREDLGGLYLSWNFEGGDNRRFNDLKPADKTFHGGLRLQCGEEEFVCLSNLLLRARFRHRRTALVFDNQPGEERIAVWHRPKAVAIRCLQISVSQLLSQTGDSFGDGTAGEFTA